MSSRPPPSTGTRWPLMLTRLAGALLCSGLTWAQAAPPELEPLVLTLVIGNNHHLEDPRRSLRFADDDALRVSQTFRRLFPESRGPLLTDLDDETRQTWTPSPTATSPIPMPPTRRGLEQAIDTLAQEARNAAPRPTRLLVYFSGHGEPGGILHLADTWLPPEQLRLLLSRVTARWVFVLSDACFSAGISLKGRESTVGTAPKPLPPLESLFPRAEPIPLQASADWLGVIAAATATQEVTALRGGLLTHVALSGLLGPADLNGDGTITFFEWGRYIRLQLRRSPEAAEIQVRPLARDPLAPLVSLDPSSSPALVLEPSFPPGLIQLVGTDGQALLAQHYHTGGQVSRFYLPPGPVTLRRIRQTTPEAAPLSLGLRAYPIERLELQLTSGSRLRLESMASASPAWLLVGAVRGPLSLPTDAPILPISFDEERLFAAYSLDASERWSRLRPAQTLPQSGWSAVLRVEQPWGGLKLSADPAVLTPGLGFRVARQRSLKLEGRWLLSGSVHAGYGLTAQPDACCDPEALRVTTAALLHRVRLGPGLSQTWIGPYWRLLLEERLSYAPQAATTTISDGLKLLGDPAHTLSWAELSTHRAFQWVQGEGELTAALLFPLGPGWELGPSVQLQGLVGRLPGRTYGVSWMTVGLELRPATIR